MKPKNEANFKLALLSGLSIGFFMQTKFPIIFPILFILETIFLFKNRLKKEYLVYLIGAVMGTLIPYINYFILGHSIFDFMRLQKFIISFYDKSLLTPHIGAIWETLIFGKFKEIFGENYINVSEWWIIWPISSGLFMFSSLLIFLKKNSNDIVKGLIIFVLFSLLILTIIPSYPRYLLVIIPFIYILSGYFINTYLDNRFKIFIFLILPFYGIFNAWFFLIPKPDWTIKKFLL
ncbi:MAG: hypothetical protein QXF25_00740 [Candidatus Pacearchaeota archaeon]